MSSLSLPMASAIVTKVTGQKVIDYLQPRLFEPLGITGEDWETSPQGANTGGWGLRLKTEDMAKFGQLYLQGGKWNGKQILPEAWVKEATTMKIMQDPDAPQGKKDSSDWLQGYCYQMWRCRHNGVRADGAFGQYIIMLPDEDAVIAIKRLTWFGNIYCLRCKTGRFNRTPTPTPGCKGNCPLWLCRLNHSRPAPPLTPSTARLLPWNPMAGKCRPSLSTSLAISAR